MKISLENLLENSKYELVHKFIQWALISVLLHIFAIQWSILDNKLITEAIRAPNPSAMSVFFLLGILFLIVSVGVEDFADNNTDKLKNTVYITARYSSDLSQSVFNTYSFVFGWGVFDLLAFGNQKHSLHDQIIVTSLLLILLIFQGVLILSAKRNSTFRKWWFKTTKNGRWVAYPIAFSCICLFIIFSNK